MALAITVLIIPKQSPPHANESAMKPGETEQRHTNQAQCRVALKWTKWLICQACYITALPLPSHLEEQNHNYSFGNWKQSSGTAIVAQPVTLPEQSKSEFKSHRK